MSVLTHKDLIENQIYVGNEPRNVAQDMNRSKPKADCPENFPKKLQTLFDFQFQVKGLL